jgi:RNA polymerase sigma factor (sigma-70 family)
MKIANPERELLQEATAGDLSALDRLLRLLQPGVYNLALRMLGQRDDAADATQEILLKIVTHLGSFRGDAAFSTWVFQVARHHLLTAATRAREFPIVSFDDIGHRLDAGLAFGGDLSSAPERVLTPEDKLAARQLALSCTQGMLMALDRPHRLAYVLDLLFDLDSQQAAEVLAITPAAYRQRLSRARVRLEGFARRTCGRINADADCRCERQLPAVAHARQQQLIPPPGIAADTAAEHAEAERAFDALVQLGDAAALFRAHPDYQAPQALLGAIREVLHSARLGSPPKA